MADANSKIKTPPGQAASPKNKRRLFEKALLVLLPILLFSYAFGISTNYSLNDPDLWWHLKTGQYILANWEVPEEDPFAYTTPVPLDEAMKIGLRSQWLGQVLLYLVYLAGGYAALGYMRGVFIILPMLFLYIWLTRKGMKPWHAVIVVSPAALMYSIQLFYSFERPQAFTFLFSIVVAALLERARTHCREGHLKPKPRLFDLSFIVLPLVMALWANIHAGYIIGDIIILIYFAAEAVRLLWHYLRGKKLKAPYEKAFFGVVAVSILASFINPNTYVTFYTYATGLTVKLFSTLRQMSGGGDPGWVESVVLEYKSLWYFYTQLDYKWLIYYWIFTGALGFFMIIKYIKRRSVDLAEVGVVTMVVLFANLYARGLMVSLAVLPFYMGKTILDLDLPKPLWWKNVFRAAIAAVLAISIGFYSISYQRMPYVLKPGVTSLWITPWYPMRAVEFLKASDIKPPMYNFYTWGGFLIWALYPKYEVFIDGRALDDMVNRTADAILKTFPGWEEKLDAYNINFILIPVAFRESGHIIPLAPTLARHNGWKLVFIRNNSAIFVRDVPQNADIIKSFPVPKEAVFMEILNVEEIFLSSSPWNPVFNISKADALFALGRYEEAKAIYERFPAAGSYGMKSLRDMGYIK